MSLLTRGKALFSPSNRRFPSVVFFLVHAAVYFLWLTAGGFFTWRPAWPALRTQLALLMITVPAWALFFTIWTILAVMRRTRRAGAYELYDDDDLKCPPRSLSYALRRSGFYIFVFVMGLCLLGSYPSQTSYRTPPKEKVYIAAMFHDNQHVLPYWIQQMTKVIHHLGKDNVFVSILESHSKDSTPALLEAFDLQLAALGVPRRIIVRDNSIPRPSKMDTEPPRIEFLAASRNKVLEPLLEKGGYQRVLFSNDVFVEADSVLDLLGTRDGNYDMACGIDLAYWGMYDAWVLRDRLGRIASSLWPYLFDDEGKQAVMNDEPAAVFSCWNGIVAFRADPVLPDHLRNVSNLTLAPLKFRASTQDECFSSESFNFPYDLRRRFNMNEIYMNPRVITSYQWRLYFWFKYVVRHWLIVWWMKHWEAGSGMLRARTIIGDEKGIWTWDGGECQPWPKKV